MIAGEGFAHDPPGEHPEDHHGADDSGAHAASWEASELDHPDVADPWTEYGSTGSTSTDDVSRDVDTDADEDLDAWLAEPDPVVPDQAAAAPGTVGALHDFEFDSWLEDALADPTGATPVADLVERVLDHHRNG